MIQKSLVFNFSLVIFLSGTFTSLISCSSETSRAGLNEAKSEQSLVETRPNILWLTFEDTSASELSVYGNTDVKNPNLEKLAKSGLVFNYAYSNAPYCSPARSSLISGSYATTFGTDHHRATIQSPDNRVYFPALLKQAGYFTSNNSKRDYNTPLNKSELAKIWNEWDNKASYNSAARKPHQPFFAVFNAGMTHMSRLTSFHLDGRRDFTQDGISANAHPGNYLPDLAEVKSDYQFHLEGVLDVDRWINIFVEDLKKRDLYENTIIFVYSDHGGSSPRGKGFLYNSGTQVPLIIHVPDKYQNLLNKPQKDLVNQVVEFVDLGPSVLSLAGIQPPEQMQGEAFIGPFAADDQKYAYTFRTNQELHFDPWRGVTDGRFNYFKTFLKRKPISLRNAFQWGMPSNQALDQFAHQNPNSEFKKVYYQAKAQEYLFDLQKDPDEIHNLAKDPAFKNRLKQMRELTNRHIENSRDLGFIPVAMKQGDRYAKWFDTDFTEQDYFALVNRVAQSSVEDITVFESYLLSNNALARFWAANGFAELAALGKITSPISVLQQSAHDSDTSVKAVVLEAQAYLGDQQAVVKLINMLNNDHALSALETMAYIKADLLAPHINTLNAKRQNGKVRSILANLGKLDPRKVAIGKHKKGVKVNQERRPLKPLPTQ